jgi:hypothetical protein
VVHKHFDYVEFERKKYDAFDFAASAAVIGDALFDIDAACSANDDFEKTEGVFTRVGDIIVFGYRKKRVEGVAYEEEDDEDEQSGGAHGTDNNGSSSLSGGPSIISNGTGPGGSKGLQKRTLAGINAVTSGGFQVFDGSNRYSGQGSSLSSLIGGAHDPYEVR